MVVNEAWQYWNWSYSTTTISSVNTMVTGWYQPNNATWTAWNNNRLNMGTTITTDSGLTIHDPVPVFDQNDATWHHRMVRNTWRNWSSTSTSVIGWDAWNTYYEETQEDRLAREERARVDALARENQWQQHLDAERRTAAERRAAEQRARELLLFHLDPQQRADLTERGYFEVISNTGKRWRIRDAGASGNVDLMPDDPSDDRRLASYCAHSPITYQDLLPKSDQHMAQKLTLETDEEAFLRVANVHFLDRERAIRRPAA